MFGFWGFPSYNKSDTIGGIPYPAEGESSVWGHAVVAVGYDDTKKIKNLNNNKVTTGALMIRNSWGKEWGDKGWEKNICTLIPRALLMGSSYR